MKKKSKVIFVCMGNICRSPTAEGVFLSLLEAEGMLDVVEVDSAGTHAYHVGEQPDLRSQAAARGRGIDLSNQRGRQFEANDFIEFDYVLAMDSENYRGLKHICPPGYEHKLHRFLEYARYTKTLDVPDPYYGAGDGFEQVLDLIEDASQGLLETLRKES
ncbi:MAG: low molecular weight phosphotyrosine protein phosphatase [Gammaproteobacteria bacterium]|nr:low molecular weight phosphotyrosine protein phosphatase [Gammaproteobacteria bacterium]